jgi:hypothetical protein
MCAWIIFIRQFYIITRRKYLLYSLLYAYECDCMCTREEKKLIWQIESAFYHSLWAPAIKKKKAKEKKSRRITSNSNNKKRETIKRRLIKMYIRSGCFYCGDPPSQITHLITLGQIETLKNIASRAFY